MAPNGPADPWRDQFRRDDGQFLQKKILLVTRGSKANNSNNITFIATFFEFIAALNAMVANESGVILCLTLTRGFPWMSRVLVENCFIFNIQFEYILMIGTRGMLW